MNERIKELAVLSNIEFTHDPTETPVRVFAECWEDELEKFAELIVKECMRMCDVAAIGYESHNHFKEANGCYSAKEYIEEHFGVEE